HGWPGGPPAVRPAGQARGVRRRGADLAGRAAAHIRGLQARHRLARPPLDRQRASRTVTIASHRVIRLRGTWVSAAQATAVYHANTHGATRIQANVSANGATTSRGWSDEIRWKMSQ